MQNLPDPRQQRIPAPLLEVLKALCGWANRAKEQADKGNIPEAMIAIESVFQTLSLGPVTRAHQLEISRLLRLPEGVLAPLSRTLRGFAVALSSQVGSGATVFALAERSAALTPTVIEAVAFLEKRFWANVRGKLVEAPELLREQVVAEQCLRHFLRLQFQISKATDCRDIDRIPQQQREDLCWTVDALATSLVERAIQQGASSGAALETCREWVQLARVNAGLGEAISSLYERYKNSDVTVPLALPNSPRIRAARCLELSGDIAQLEGNSVDATLYYDVARRFHTESPAHRKFQRAQEKAAQIPSLGTGGTPTASMPVLDPADWLVSVEESSASRDAKTSGEKWNLALTRLDPNRQLAGVDLPVHLRALNRELNALDGQGAFGSALLVAYLKEMSKGFGHDLDGLVERVRLHCVVEHARCTRSICGEHRATLKEVREVLAKAENEIAQALRKTHLPKQLMNLFRASI